MAQKTYTVSDGELVLTLEPLPAEEGGGYGVTCPLEPQLVTEAKTFEEAFEAARDAIQALRDSASGTLAALLNYRPPSHKRVNRAKVGKTLARPGLPFQPPWRQT